MKQSIAITTMILVIGMIPAWIQHRLWKGLRDEHGKLHAEASAYGWIPPRADGMSRTKKARTDDRARASALAVEVAAFINEFKSLPHRSAGLADEIDPRMAAWKDRIQSMSPEMLEQVITDLERNREIPDGVRHGILSSAVARWAGLSPDSALSWWRGRTQSDHADVGHEISRAVIIGTASMDPERAFTLMGELFPDDPTGALRAIVAGCHESDAGRDAFVSTLRKHLAGIPDPDQREQLADAALDSLARHVVNNGFEETVAWMDRAGLSAGEKHKFSSGLSYFDTKEDTGRWIDWLSVNLAADRAAAPVYGLMSEWTQKDHQSAGKWLLAADDGPAKTGAVKAYATAVARFEPKVAAEWAMTLPAGPQRDATLRAVHQHWPSSDPAGAETFAKQHGLK